MDLSSKSRAAYEYIFKEINMEDTAPLRVRGYGSNLSTGFRIRSPDQGISVYTWLHYSLAILYLSFASTLRLAFLIAVATEPDPLALFVSEGIVFLDMRYGMCPQ